MRKKVIVVGGGASGLTAAISAARAGASVLVVEQMDKPAKKILATGNGRCNYTNEYMDISCFHSENIELCQHTIKKIDTRTIVSFFEELGVVPKAKDGYYYPNSMQASSVADVLILEAMHLGVKIVCGEKVVSIKKNDQQFIVKTEKNVFRSDAVILATGGKASKKLGSDGSGYKIAKALGLKVTEIVPALTGLKCSGRFFKAVSGVRTQAFIEIYDLNINADMPIAKDCGELQLTAYGISGIPVFQVSRNAAMALRCGHRVKAIIDFMPDYTIESFKVYLKSRFIKMNYKTAMQCLTGMIPFKLIHLFLSSAAIDDDCLCCNVPDEKIEKLAIRIKKFELTVVDTNTFDEAQVSAGGVDTTQIQTESMMVKHMPGLYIIGELLDVDGACGGYNLHFAWASGIIAGTHAGKGDTD